MTPKEFVSQVRLVVVQQSTAERKDLFESTLPAAATDPYWKRALSLYRSLSEADRAVLLEIVRQTTVDSVSELLGILDSSSPLKVPREGFVLFWQSDDRKLNGDLQDLFLELEETERRNLQVPRH